MHIQGLPKESAQGCNKFICSRGTCNRVATQQQLGPLDILSDTCHSLQRCIFTLILRQFCAPGSNSSLDKGMGACEMQKATFFCNPQSSFCSGLLSNIAEKGLSERRHLSDEQGSMERRPSAKQHGSDRNSESSNQEALGKLTGSSSHSTPLSLVQFSDYTNCHGLLVQNRVVIRS